MTRPLSMMDSHAIDTLVGTAVLLTDDDILGNVDQAAGQVTGVCGTQRGIRQDPCGRLGRR